MHQGLFLRRTLLSFDTYKGNEIRKIMQSFAPIFCTLNRYCSCYDEMKHKYFPIVRNVKEKLIQNTV